MKKHTPEPNYTIDSHGNPVPTAKPFDVTQRCQHCGGTRKEHAIRKPYRCPTKLTESYWEPWTVEAYEAAVETGRAAVAAQASKPRLEWDGKNLYRVEGTKRVFIGFVAQEVFGTGWNVYVRSTRKHTLDSEDNARKQLEAYA